MYLARILYPVEVLGPGKRIGLWFAGCPHHCPECSNPELWAQPKRYSVAAERIMEMICGIAAEHPVDGFTLTGGDPFYQPEALCALTEQLCGISRDILIYTGYTLEELHAMHSEAVEKTLSAAAVLIDGRYIAARNTGCALRGSDNQIIHILNSEFQAAYDAYLQQENRIQNFMIGTQVVSVGIHRPGFRFTGG